MWEYLHIKPVTIDQDDLSLILDGYGEEGWELVSVVFITKFHLFFKRFVEKKQKDEPRITYDFE